MRSLPSMAPRYTVHPEHKKGQTPGEDVCPKNVLMKLDLIHQHFATLEK